MKDLSVKPGIHLNIHCKKLFSSLVVSMNFFMLTQLAVTEFVHSTKNFKFSVSQLV